jgi:hypothetical protein
MACVSYITHLAARYFSFSFYPLYFSPKKCTKEGDFSYSEALNSRAANLKSNWGATTTTVVACADNQRPYLTVMQDFSTGEKPNATMLLLHFSQSIGDSF